ncbi:alpha/beta fold hydrolase [Candidatus Amarolinea dominans]|uniref:alpha/beta fold hydrolase n=1 Tax=Candidatus Amarolinea dominans TaxID=3140696 RepID=UPI001DB172C6|nr:alpha/beta fold hydrolase [Anaerolineae bacterium]
MTGNLQIGGLSAVPTHSKRTIASSSLMLEVMAQSDKPHDPAAYVLEKQAGDIVAVLDKLGVDKAHYFGYSLGGTVGLGCSQVFP